MASTRLCVKGLPKHLTKDRLREHFAAIGEVTDARICTTRTEKEAKKAKSYFNDSFIDTSKICIEIAKPVGDEHLSRPWSKYSSGSSANDRVARKSEKKGDEEATKKLKDKKAAPLTEEQQLLQKLKTDSEMRSFVEAMKPRRKNKIWENDDQLLNSQETIVKQEQVKSKKAGGDGVVLTRTHMKFESEESDEEYQDAPATKRPEPETDGVSSAPADTAAAAFDSTIDDLQYLKAKMKNNWKDSDEEEGGEDSGKEDPLSDTDTDPAAAAAAGGANHDSHGPAGDDPAHSDSEMEEEGPAVPGRTRFGPAAGGEAAEAVATDGGGGGESDDEDAEESGRLFVRNLPFSVTEEDLIKFFGRYGDLSEVHLCINKTKKPTGIAYILYLFPAHARAARDKLNGKFFQGRLLHILPAKLRTAAAGDPNSAAGSGGGDGDGDGGGGKEGGVGGARGVSTYKQKKQEGMKKAAGAGHNWATLFMRGDTVAEAVAQEHAVDKHVLLDPAAEGSMAVRMALGETQMIQETKRELEAEGVNIAAFEVAEKPKDRSRTAILVKNIPYSTTEQEIRDLFSRPGGDLHRVILPRTRTMAIVEYDSPADARRAFRVLAYSKFKFVPLYLEWAPTNTFLDSAPSAAAAAAAAGDGADEDGDDGDGGGGGGKVAVSAVPAAGKKVTALAPAAAARDGGKAAAARDAPAADTASRTEKPATKRAAVAAAAGDGGSSNPAAAGAGVNSAARRGAARDAEGGEPAGPGRTVYVKNLNFETTEAGLRKAFEPVGGVRAVKIMTKVKGSGPRLSMGYGFVEFADTGAARRAAQEMNGARLDGHVLLVKLSERQGAEGGGGPEPVAGRGGAGGGGGGGAAGAEDKRTKLIVRNVPFEGTKKELRELLGAFGQLSSLRIPKKMDGAHRGFAFADFLTHAEAEAARAALQNTHLYGRHLVLEYAEESNSLESLRLKTARYLSHLSAPGDRASKRQRLEATLEGGDDGGAFADAFDD